MDDNVTKSELREQLKILTDNLSKRDNIIFDQQKSIMDENKELKNEIHQLRQEIDGIRNSVCKMVDDVYDRLTGLEFTVFPGYAPTLHQAAKIVGTEVPQDDKARNLDRRPPEKS